MSDKSAGLDIANNKKRIFDQMASMHFRLSDEYKHFACIEDAIEIIVSVALCGITFLDFQEYFNITIQKPTLIVGCISIFLLAFTLIKQSVGHKIAEWKATEVSTEDILNYIDSHFSSLNDLPQIPEKHFNRLKHWHQVKVEMSKFLDAHKNDFWLICKIKFRFFRN